MSANGRISLHVEHQDPVLAAGLRAVLGESGDFVLVPCSAQEALAAIAGYVDLIVADYPSGMDWLCRTRDRRHLSGMPRVMIVTTLAGETEARAALSAGISAYVIQGCDVAELRRAALTAARGARYVAPPVAQRLMDSLAHEALTAREVHVLDLIAVGMCNKAIAKELEISLATVKTHVSSILDKLCATSRTQAVSRAGDRGLIAASQPGRDRLNS